LLGKSKGMHLWSDARYCAVPRRAAGLALVASPEVASRSGPATVGLVVTEI
jgi:hypothetical protein